MSHWTNINTIYLYDGSFEGFLTCVFWIFKKKQIPFQILNKATFTCSLFQETLEIETDYSLSSRVFDSIPTKISDLALYHNYYTFLSNEPNKEMYILKYLITGFEYGPSVDQMLTIDEILKVQKISKKVAYEVQRLRGFVRFRQIGENLFYSKINPDHNILEILSNHFKNRLSNQNWILHDANRDIVSCYNKKNYTIISAKEFSIPQITSQEKKYQDLWTLFFHTITIAERTNPRLQLQYMPKRYWKNIFETY